MKSAQVVMLAALAVSAAALMVKAPRPVLLWNATASAPEGLYLVRPVEPARRGDLVAAHAREPWATWLAQRGYLPHGVPLVKSIAAVGAQQVCRAAAVVSVDGRAMVRARPRDRLGRPLPVWGGCRRLKPYEVLLLNPSAPDSLDGRYFGPSLRADLIGVLVPIWTRGA